jgi:hypothetical protein
MIGLLFILFTLLYLLFGYFLYGYIRGWGPGKVKSLLITLVILVGVPFGDVIPGKLYLAYVCHKDGGIKVNEVVNTQGYLVLDDYSYGCDRGCIRKLEEWRRLGKPMFIEAFVKYPKESNFVDKPGYYRFELVERTPENCVLQRLITAKYPKRFKRSWISEKYCVSSKAIDYPEADYSVALWEHDYHVSDLLGIISDNSYVRRTTDNQVIATATRFTHLGGWVRRSIENTLPGGSGKVCPSDLGHGYRSKLLQVTFNSSP